MGLHSKDDELIQRGANPRTGIISPYVLSDAVGDSLKGNYIVMGNVEPKGKTRGGSGKWKQNGSGGCLVDQFSAVDWLSTENPQLNHGEPENIDGGDIHLGSQIQKRAREEDRYGEKISSSTKSDIGQSSTYSRSARPSTLSDGVKKIHRKEVGSGLSSRKLTIQTMTATNESKNRFKPIPLSLSSKNPSLNSGENNTTSKSCCQASKNRQFPPPPSSNQTINPAPDTAVQDAHPSRPNFHLKTPSASLPSPHSQHPINPTHLTVPYGRPQRLFPTHLRPKQPTSIPNSAYPNNTTNAAIITTMPNILHRPPIQRANGALPLPKFHPYPPPHHHHHHCVQPSSLPAASTTTPVPQPSSHPQPDQKPNSPKVNTPPQPLNPNLPTITLTAPPNESEVHHQSHHHPNAGNDNPLPTPERLLLVLFYLVILIHAGLAVNKVMGVMARVVGVVWVGVVVGRWVMG